MHTLKLRQDVGFRLACFYMKKYLILFAFLCTANFISSAPAAEIASRPAQWAQPITLPGVPNLHKINDQLYRSAQPTKEGMANLSKLGIKTVINLRAFHSDRDEIGSLPLAYESIRMNTWHPEVEDVIRFLKIVNDPARAPILVHCQHGADRTGTMSAIYRIIFDGWSKEDAIQEMTEGGFGFHAIWTNLPPWIRTLDIVQLKAAAGIRNTSSKL